MDQTASLQFELQIPRKIVFGWGRRAALGALAASFGKRAFVIDGSRTLRRSPAWQEMLDSLNGANVSAISLGAASGEPTIRDVDELTRQLLACQPGAGDVVIGIGGGSALDLAKAVSAMATNSHGASVREFLEGIGTGRTISQFPLPLIAVPTTSGTGSEATKNAVISCDDPPCKKSLRSDWMLPVAALVDPELTVSNPPQQTAWCGMDAITQLIESAVTRRAQPVSNWCANALRNVFPALEQAYRHPEDRPAREAMSFAALASGIALANSGLGMAHGVAAPLGSICNVPHGLACAVMLPIAIRTNAHEKPDAWRNIAGMITPDGGDATTVLNAVVRLSETLQLPRRLRDIGVAREQIPDLVAGSRGNSMNGNPRELSDAELTEILETHW